MIFDVLINVSFYMKKIWLSILIQSGKKLYQIKRMRECKRGLREIGNWKTTAEKDER